MRTAVSHPALQASSSPGKARPMEGMFWPASTCSSSAPSPSGKAWLSRKLGFSTLLTLGGWVGLTCIEHLLCTIAPAMDTAVSNRPCQRPSQPLLSPSHEAQADEVTFKAVLMARKSWFFPGSLGPEALLFPLDSRQHLDCAGVTGWGCRPAAGCAVSSPCARMCKSRAEGGVGREAGGEEDEPGLLGLGS